MRHIRRSIRFNRSKASTHPPTGGEGTRHKARKQDQPRFRATGWPEGNVDFDDTPFAIVWTKHVVLVQRRCYFLPRFLLFRAGLGPRFLASRRFVRPTS